MASAQVQEAIDNFKKIGLERYFDEAYGYAVWPNIGKAGIFFVGGAHGSGEVFAKKDGSNEPVKTGTSSISELSGGWTLGGQVFSQVLFFEKEYDYNRFIQGTFEFGAGADVCIITAAAEAEITTKGTELSGGVHNKISKVATEWIGGMAVATTTKGGLMYNATVKGQKCTFRPV